jgi:hypothetical protein
MRQNQRAAYHEGFFDALDGEPLFDDAHDDYKAGWRAYWEVRDMLSDPDFLASIHKAKLPHDRHQDQFNN